ncbi:MAG: peptidoglycan-binding protein [Rhizobiales bacterium]|nr:peptidoglycan-binding protein [Hyphomicrobiales bacterium]
MAISVRNNNPGALMYAPWEKAYGAVPGGKNVAGTLARFPTPAQGYAAAAQWHRRAEAKGMVTLRQRMRVYAPPDGAGNSQASFNAYVKRLADAMGITPDTPFSIDDPNLGPKLLLAHAQFESGLQDPFPAGALEAGYKMGPSAAPAGAPVADAGRQPTLRRGDYSNDVRDWQGTLAANDFSPGIGDGKFGRMTAAQTKAFQKQNWLTPDSVVGPQTRFAGNLGRDIRQGAIAQPAGGTQTVEVSPEAFGFGPRLLCLGCRW